MILDGPLAMEHEPDSPRVCILQRYPFPQQNSPISNGGILNTWKVAEALAGRGCRVELFTAKPSPPSTTESWGGRIRVHRIHVPQSTHVDYTWKCFEEGTTFSTLLRAHPAFAQTEYAAIHTNHWSSTLPPLRPAERAHLHVHTPHLSAVEKAVHMQTVVPQRILRLEQTALLSADVIIALTNAEKACLVEHHGLEPSKIAVIPNGIDSVFFDRPLPPPDSWDARCSKPRLVTVARLAHQKGIDLLVGAAALLRSRGICFSWDLCGGTCDEASYGRMVWTLIDRYSLNQSVRFLGLLDRAPLAQLLSGCTAYVQTSRYESQGVAMIEAMAAGLPIVTTHLPCIPEILGPASQNLVVWEHSPQAIANAVEQMVTTPDRCRALSTTNRLRAARFSWQHAVQDTLRCFQFGDEPDA